MGRLWPREVREDIKRTISPNIMEMLYLKGSNILAELECKFIIGLAVNDSGVGGVSRAPGLEVVLEWPPLV